MGKPITIITWNLERPAPRAKRVPRIISALAKLSADIIVLTETHAGIAPDGGYAACRSLLLAPDQDANGYRTGELRISIFSRYPIVQQLRVTNSFTTACALIDTSNGPLAVYGAIIGIRGRGRGFYTDLQEQSNDLHRLASQYPVCYAGDFNLSFCDNYFPNKKAKALLEETFSALRLRNLTGNIPANIDHIALSESFIDTRHTAHFCWNEDKLLSDHKGIGIKMQDGI